MSIATDLKAILSADTTLTGLATGGIFTFEDTGRMGISFQNTPSAYNGAYLKPSVLIKTRVETPVQKMRDEAAQFTAVSQIIEIWAYEEYGKSLIESLLGRIYTLLNDKRYTGLGRFSYAGTRGQGQQEELNGATSDVMYFQRNFSRLPT